MTDFRKIASGRDQVSEAEKEDIELKAGKTLAGSIAVFFALNDVTARQGVLAAMILCAKATKEKGADRREFLKVMNEIWEKV